MANDERLPNIIKRCFLAKSIEKRCQYIPKIARIAKLGSVPPFVYRKLVSRIKVSASMRGIPSRWESTVMSALNAYTFRNGTYLLLLLRLPAVDPRPQKRIVMVHRTQDTVNR